jgi:hypothetical protein
MKRITITLPDLHAQEVFEIFQKMLLILFFADQFVISIEDAPEMQDDAA